MSLLQKTKKFLSVAFCEHASSGPRILDDLGCELKHVNRSEAKPRISDKNTLFLKILW